MIVAASAIILLVLATVFVVSVFADDDAVVSAVSLPVVFEQLARKIAPIKIKQFFIFCFECANMKYRKEYCN